MEFAIAVLLALAVGLFVSEPLRRAPRERDGESSDVVALEAAKEAKYREIRDLELDHATGKVGYEDFAAANAELRAEAIAILDRLDSVRAGAAGSGQEPAVD